MESPLKVPFDMVYETGKRTVRQVSGIWFHIKNSTVFPKRYIRCLLFKAGFSCFNINPNIYSHHHHPFWFHYKAPWTEIYWASYYAICSHRFLWCIILHSYETLLINIPFLSSALSVLSQGCTVYTDQRHTRLYLERQRSRRHKRQLISVSREQEGFIRPALWCCAGSLAEIIYSS